jgi:acyl phosphate:glycerol-3-phosphate acyltransferase
MSPWFLTVVAYLCGSVPFGVLLAKRFANADVRAAGSGNIGATNVARVAGKKIGALTLLLDAAKGALPVWVATTWAPGDSVLHAAVGFAAFVGHVFPVWLKFKGGKGVATAVGVLAVLLPWAALAGFAVWLLTVVTIRLSSLGSLLGTTMAIGVAFALPGPRAYAVLAVVFLVAMLWTHRANLRRLASKAENTL